MIVISLVTHLAYNQQEEEMQQPLENLLTVLFLSWLEMFSTRLEITLKVYIGKCKPLPSRDTKTIKF